MHASDTEPHRATQQRQTDGAAQHRTCSCPLSVRLLVLSACSCPHVCPFACPWVACFCLLSVRLLVLSVGFSVPCLSVHSSWTQTGSHLRVSAREKTGSRQPSFLDPACLDPVSDCLSVPVNGPYITLYSPLKGSTRAPYIALHNLFTGPI